MIEKVSINNYKGINDAVLKIRPLTILTGLNSTGKSSCFQAILTSLYYTSPTASMLMEDMDLSFETLRNKNVNAKDLSIRIECGNGGIKFQMTPDSWNSENPTGRDLEKNVYYLSANRLGYSDLETISPKYKIGMAGEYILGTFDQEKSNPVEERLIMLKESVTLSSHVNYWLSYILGIKFEMQTEKVTPTKVKVLYKSDDLPNLSPQQLGVGVSYLVKILVMCLRAKKGDVLMIENPEIHLHPAAQARLGEFFTYIVNAGIQVLIETHCEHLINKLQYQIYKDRFAHTEAVIYYKGAIDTPFDMINFTTDGKFEDSFPEGFFDATLEELLEME